MTHQTARNAQAALVRAAASFVRDTYSGEWADDAAATLETDADLIERGEPCSLLRLAETMQPAAVSAAVAPPTNQTALRETIADVGVTPPPALTEEGRLRAQVQVLQQDAERDQGLAKVGARCMREGHQGLIESGRATIEGHRFALSVALGLGTGAPWDAIHERVKELRRMADETATETPETPTVAWHILTHQRGTWRPWLAPRDNSTEAREDYDRCVSDNGHRWAFRLVRETSTFTVESEHQPAGARQDEVWPVKEATRHYAEELRATPGQAAADGHTGWECDAGAQLLISATTPGPGALGTHHGTIYACPVHQGAALQRITGAGYQADPRPVPPGHRWNPWPCGHVTAYDAQALTVLTAAGARQDGAET